MNEKHINIRQASNGFVVNYYENTSMGGLSVSPSGIIVDTTAVFSTLDDAVDYVKNILSGAKSATIVGGTATETAAG